MTKDKILINIGAVVLSTTLIGLVATLTGTILWSLYPHIHSLFPTAANNGVIAKDLSWWDSVCITWIFAILIKSGGTSTDKKEK